MKEMQVAFDAKQAVIDKPTHLDDKLKQLKEQQAASAEFHSTMISAVEEEIEAWQAFLSGAEKPAAKKAAAKKSA